MGQDLTESIDVSIRSPHRSEGRFRYGPASVAIDPFQSAPPTEVRGDKRHW